MVILNSYFDITRGYPLEIKHGDFWEIPELKWRFWFGEIVEVNLSGFPASHMWIPEDKYIGFMEI